MIAFLLAVCFLVVMVAAFKQKSDQSRPPFKKGAYVLAGLIGVLLAIGTIWNAASTLLVTPDQRFPSSRFAFRNGSVEVVPDQSRGIKIVAVYKEWSWFHFKKEGEWRVMADGSGGWKYFVMGKWKIVPEEILSGFASSDDRDRGYDNHGPFDQ